MKSYLDKAVLIRGPVLQLGVLALLLIEDILENVIPFVPDCLQLLSDLLSTLTVGVGEQPFTHCCKIGNFHWSCLLLQQHLLQLTNFLLNVLLLVGICNCCLH